MQTWLRSLDSVFSGIVLPDETGTTDSKIQLLIMQDRGIYTVEYVYHTFVIVCAYSITNDLINIIM